MIFAYLNRVIQKHGFINIFKINKNMKTTICSISFLIMTFFLALPAKAQFLVDLETGFVSTGYNDVRIPGDQGSLFSFKDDLDAKASLFFRLRANYTIKSRHTISLLYAPLETKSEGSAANDILFEGTIFPANTQLDGTYKFNSYRITYRYDIVNKPNIVFGLGLTAKIRDAEISLSSTDLTSVKTNVGFVPIINFRLWWKMNDKFGLLLDGDALAAPQGRAEDVHLAATYTVNDNIVLRAGYRILEGGADNDEVYNFSLFNYAAVGISYTFKTQ
jgi:hypothetical protein